MNHSERQAAEMAATRLRKAILRLSEAETKSGFNPSQPRTPAGNGRESGRWIDGLTTGVGHVVDGLNRATHALTHGLGRALHHVERPFHKEIDAAVASAPPEVKEFISANKEAIENTLSTLQAMGGLAQGVEGADLIAAGLATAPEGLPIAALGGWMVARGYDDWDTGVRALVSGDPQTGGFYNALRGFGFSDESAQATLATTSGLPASAAKEFSRAQLEAAADKALLVSAADALKTRGIQVTTDGSSLWSIKDILARGTAWEITDSKITGFDLAPPGMPTFDLVNKGQTIAVSDKTLDLRADFYGSASPTAVQNRVKGMIDKVADFKYAKRSWLSLSGNQLEERWLRLLIPAGRAEPGQEAQLKAAASYAESRGVKFRITYGR